MGSTSADSGRRLPANTTRARVREQEAAKLYRAGLTFDQIAERLEYADRSGARKAVYRALDSRPR